MGWWKSAFRGRAASAVVAASLVLFTLAGVIHNHGLPGDPGRASSIRGGRTGLAHEGPCPACRISHQQFSFPLAPPDVRLPGEPGGRLDFVPVRLPRPAPRLARASRAPPASPPIAI